MSEDFNLEDEYGSFLDILEESLSSIPSDSIQQHGVKGMHWGVRKDKPSANREPVKSLGPDSVSRKTASGETITLQKVPPTKLHNFLGRHSKGYREDYAKQAMLNILDSSGKKVGDAMVQKKSKDELYLEWLGINKSERGKGYASAVMQAGRDFGKQEGFKKMVLEVPGNSPDARHIYEKLGFKYVGEVDGGFKDPVFGGLSKMEYDFETAHSGIEHHGVKGMHWGVRKDTPMNANYSQKQQALDRRKLGEAGVKRVNRNMNKGMGIGKARKKEASFRAKRSAAIAGGLVAAKLVAKYGPVAMQVVAIKAETNRGRAATAVAMGLPRVSSSGPIFTQQKRGAYKITTI